MKFAKELDQELVPEWRAKYFDYKQAKKRIKRITNALRSKPGGSFQKRRPDPRQQQLESDRTPLARTSTIGSEASTLKLPESALGVSGEVMKPAYTRTEQEISDAPAVTPLDAFDINKSPPRQNGRPLIRSLLSRSSSILSRSSSHYTDSDVPLEAWKLVDTARIDFWKFLDQELVKIEEFYQSKENEATRRLEILKEQLHIMRDQHLERATKTGTGKHVRFKTTPKPNYPSTPTAQARSQADYVRRPVSESPSYLSAKRKLKAALEEYYRALELLKSYAILNRTAYRKINKKYDKSVNVKPKMRCMTEKINNANFVKSDIVDGLIVAVEDLYARYFEKGSHKRAVGKLRKSGHGGSYTSSTWHNGLMAGAGVTLAIQAVVYGAEFLNDVDIIRTTQTAYLLQIYAGYFLLLFQFLLFCINCKIFSVCKINYTFIFEFDTRHNLDWRQLSTIPCFCLFLLGLAMWINFHQFGGNTIFLYYPVILLGITAIALFLPFPVFYHRSRRWFLYSCWRLLPSGLYRVEWRDFFLGDMFCSQTYSFGGIELFFCLYASDWRNPQQCNSSHSRLLGFFSTMPGIWRALQCLRRYHDSKQVWPQLANFGKYMCTVIAYMTLSLWRINQTDSMIALYITFSLVNSIYCSFWDLYVDWSLMDPHAKHPFLRNTLAYKRVWWYYFAICIDPILRFNWIFHIIYKNQAQHSSKISFFIALSEVIRRFIWTIIRVENEHCNNVTLNKASRDIDLPYHISDAAEVDSESAICGPSSSNVSGATLDIPEATTSNLRRRTSVGPRESAQKSPSIGNRVGKHLQNAHAQDFERKKSPSERSGGNSSAEEEDDEEEEIEEHADREEMAEVREMNHTR